MLLTRGYGNRDGLARPFTKDMNFGGIAATALPKPLFLKAFFTAYGNTIYVFFAPAAALCARTMLPSRAANVKSI
jgi:hypothetical protein